MFCRFPVFVEPVYFTLKSILLPQSNGRLGRDSIEVRFPGTLHTAACLVTAGLDRFRLVPKPKVLVYYLYARPTEDGMSLDR